jgi:lysophospholipase L1-like esterase
MPSRQSSAIRVLFLATVLLLVAGPAAACGLWPRSTTAGEARPLTYVALGASDSVGVGANVPELESWVSVLHGELPPGSRLVNLGVSGTLLREAIDQQLPVALDSDPDLVTVWLAVNDLNARVPLERYAAELDRLLSALRQGTHATILVGNIPDVARLPAYQQVDRRVVRAEVDRWNASIAEVVARHGAELVDLHAGWQELAEHPEYVGRDGFHPSTEGHRRLAGIFRDAVVQRTDML